MPLDIKLNISLHPKQQYIHDNARKYTVTLAGKRFGKSKLGVYRLIQKAGHLPGGTVWAVAPYYSQAKSIIWWELLRLLPPQLIRRKIETDLFVELWNGCRIFLKGADHEDSLRGPRLDHLLMDEAAFCREHVWDRILRGQLLGTGGGGTADFISSPNPKGRNWFSDFHATATKRMQDGDPDWAGFYYTLWENNTLPREEIEKLKNDLPEDLWNLEYMAIESEHAGRKYSEFDYAKHVVPFASAENLLAYRGLDWGLEHPSTCLWAKVDRINGIVWIYDELCKSGLVIEEVCKTIFDKTGDTKIEWSVLDPSANRRDVVTGRSVKDEFLRCGLGCVDGDRRGADDKLGRGVNIVKMMFKKNMIRIDPRCKTLIYELRNLQWGDKIGDDCTDALRYLLVRLHDLVFQGILHEVTPESTAWKAPAVFNISMFKSRNAEYSTAIREEINTH